MPPLSALAQADAATIVTDHGESIALTSPEGDIYITTCIVVHSGVTIDAEGLRMIGESMTATISTTNLAALGLADPEVLKAKGWKAEINGQSYRLNEAPVDYTRGLVELTLKKAAA